METHTKKAEDLFKQGYNCSQAVLGAYSEELGIDFKTLMQLSSSFGGGMGRLREVCGAVSAMFMIAGLKKGYFLPTDNEGKKNHYKLIQELAKKFKEKHQTIICRELLNLMEKESNPTPAERTEQYYKTRPCIKFVQEACNIVDETIFQNVSKI